MSDSGEKVYLMQHELGPIKIGVSQKPKKRLKDIDIGPFEVRLIGVLNSGSPRKLERALHQFHQIDNIRGEWFDLDIEQVENIFKGNDEEQWLDYVDGGYATTALVPPFNVDSLDTVTVAKPVAKVQNHGKMGERELDGQDKEAIKKREKNLMWQGLVG